MRKIINKHTALVFMLVFALTLIGCGAATQSEKTDAPSTEIETTETESLNETESTEEAFVTEDALSETESETESESEDAVEKSDVESNDASTGKTATKSAPQTETPGYTFTDMDKTMYATTNVNVRNLPSTDGTKLGALNYNQSVKVTGKCNETGWYRIEFNSNTAYVSNSYLSETKQPEKTSAPKTSSNAGNTTSGGTAPAQTQEAYFDRDKAVAVFNAINAERAANGIAQLAWDEGIYNFACGRAQTLVNDYSHTGRGDYGENIGKANWVWTADEIHTGFYNSPHHHENYLKSTYDRGAVAVYVLNGSTYVCENFALSAGNNYVPDYGSAAGSASGMPQRYGDVYVVDHWTASNGVVIDVLSDGSTQGSYPDMDMLLAAMDEYDACH